MDKQKSVILQILYGQRDGCKIVKCTPEYKECSDKAAEYYNALCEKLKDMPEEIELLSNYCDWNMKAHIAEIDANYLEAFKFGLLIGVEAGESKFED